MRKNTDRGPGLTGSDRPDFLVQVDGSSRKNPGPAGIGVRITSADGSRVREISRSIGIRTNNQAEYEALLCALRETRDLGDRSIVIQTDSELLYYQVTGRYKVKNLDLRDLHAQVTNLLCGRKSTRLELVRREQNRLTDKLAKAAADVAADTADATPD